jgi:hypothetical protein
MGPRDMMNVCFMMIYSLLYIYRGIFSHICHKKERHVTTFFEKYTHTATQKNETGVCFETDEKMLQTVHNQQRVKNTNRNLKLKRYL